MRIWRNLPCRTPQASETKDKMSTRQYKAEHMYTQQHGAIRNRMLRKNRKKLSEIHYTNLKYCIQNNTCFLRTHKKKKNHILNRRELLPMVEQRNSNREREYNT